MEATARGAARPLGPGRAHRLVTGVFRLGNRARLRGAEKTGPNPTDHGKQGSKRHLVVDRNGIALTVRHTAANVHYSKALKEVVDAIGSIRRPRGRPRKRPEKLHADKGYHFPRCRKALVKRGIKSRIARRGYTSGCGATGGWSSGPCRS